MEEVFIWRDKVKYLKLLKPQDVKEILSELDFTYFRCIEFPVEDLYMYSFKRNPEVWANHINFDDDYDRELYYSFYYGGESNNLRMVNSRKEGYYYAIHEEFGMFYWKLYNKKHSVWFLTGIV